MTMGYRLPSQGRLARWLRRLGWGRNPLLRSVDRIQAATRAGLLVAFLVSAPLAALFFGRGTDLSALRTQQAQLAARHLVPAQILRVKAIRQAFRKVTSPSALLTVRWTSPDGTVHSGKITGPANAVTGNVIRVWTDSHSRLAHRPVSHADIMSRVIRTAIAAPLAIALLLILLSRAIALALDRHRLARWGTDWSAVEPQWTGRP